MWFSYTGTFTMHCNSCTQIYQCKFCDKYFTLNECKIWLTKSFKISTDFENSLMKILAKCQLMWNF